MLIHSISTTSIHRVSFQVVVSIMSDQSDSQNRSEEQIDMIKGTSPSSSTDEGSRSTLSNLPKAATRKGGREPQILKMRTMLLLRRKSLQRKRLSRKSLALQLQPSLDCTRKLLPRECQCPKPKPQHRKPLSSLLNQRRLVRARRGRNGSRIPWPE